jgi:hypothetical protein
MTHAPIRHGMLLALAFYIGCHAFAGGFDVLDPAQWSTIANDSSKEQLLLIIDVATTIGNIFIKKQKAKGNPTKLSKPGESFTLAPRTAYFVYFDTNLGNMAMTIGIGSCKNKVELNFKRAFPPAVWVTDSSYPPPTI